MLILTTTQISSSTKSILPNEAFYIIHVSGNTLSFSSSSSFIFMPFVGMLQLILTSQFFIDKLKSNKYQIGFQDRKPPMMLQHFKKPLLACSWLWRPENCIRLQCRQSSDKPFHPEHHCYSIWPRTGNIIRAHREPAKILLNSQEGYTFYSPSNPHPHPSLQSTDSIPQGGPTDEGWLRRPALVTHFEDCLHCVN